MEERETVTENVPWWTFVMSSLPVMVVETRSWWNRCILGFYSKFLPDVVTASVCGWRLRIWCSEKRQTNSQQCGPHSLRPHSSLPIQKKKTGGLYHRHTESSYEAGKCITTQYQHHILKCTTEQPHGRRVALRRKEMARTGGRRKYRSHTLVP